MKKIETIWHHLLHEALIHHTYRHTQQELAGRFQYSLSTIHHAIKTPVEIGAIRKASKFFVLADFKKLLYYWASLRSLQRDIVYKSLMEKPVLEVEGLAVPRTVFACYSAARHHLGEAPADYAKVYWYAAPEDLRKTQERFGDRPKTKTEANVFILRAPGAFICDGYYTTLVHTFVDVWNLTDWYARDFCKALEEKIDGLLS